MEESKRIGELLNKLKEAKPLVHHLTNYVTVNDCANITLAIGASPVMADDINEVREMVSLASALVLNLGTLNSLKLEAMIEAGKQANELNIPVILDPVGVGATSFRIKAAERIISELKLSAIKGNLSEIKAVYGTETLSRGVDSTDLLAIRNNDFEEIKIMAKALAVKLDTVIAVTGQVDIATDGKTLYYIENGHEMMSRISGTGCMCSSLLGAFSAVEEDKLHAVLAGIVSMGVSGEIAYEILKPDCEGTGSYKIKLMDAVYNLTEKQIRERAKISKE